MREGLKKILAVPTQNLRLLNEFPSRVEYFSVKVSPVKIDGSEYLLKLFDQTQP